MLCKRKIQALVVLLPWPGVRGKDFCPDCAALSFSPFTSKGTVLWILCGYALWQDKWGGVEFPWSPAA